MKASHKSRQFATPGSFQPDPLTPEQLNAIDLLIQGKSDQEVADLIGKARETVQAASEHGLRWCGVNSTLSVGVTPRM